ncbi:MAG: isoprenylcysteine carboxylmethyltransferase family protein [Armatimonadetes bacterium]|nr:isoprenylcysteine carboxylmethyltransferase family protein [Armatimonadota bacterium]
MSRSKANWLSYAPLAIAYAAFVHPRFVGGSELVDESIDVVGFLIVTFGLVIRILSRNWKLVNVGLVTSGPYAVVRNPMYVGSFLIGLGLCVIIGNAAFLTGFAVVFCVAHAIAVRGEERILAKKWPETYRVYRSTVPAWLPSLAGLRKAIHEDRSWLSYRKETIAKEITPICGALIASLLLETQEDWLVKGWRLAHTEALVSLVLAALIFVFWSVSMLKQWNRSFFSR